MGSNQVEILDLDVHLFLIVSLHKPQDSSNQPFPVYNHLFITDDDGKSPHHNKRSLPATFLSLLIPLFRLIVMSFKFSISLLYIKFITANLLPPYECIHYLQYVVLIQNNRQVRMSISYRTIGRYVRPSHTKQ